MKGLTTIHPGEILREEYLEPLHISAYKLAKDIGVPQTRIGEIINERRGITPDTALRLGQYFNTEPQFWLNLQNNYDLRLAAVRLGKTIASIDQFQSPVVSNEVKT